MNEPLDKLEREVDASLKALADQLDVEPPPAASVAQIKAAARRELDELWLAGHPAPAPPEQAVASVKAAVRAELARRSLTPMSSAWYVAPLAAAALIAFVIGIGWFSRRPVASPEGPAVVEEKAPVEDQTLLTQADTPQEHDGAQTDELDVDRLVAAADGVADELTVAEAVAEELETVNQQIADLPANWGDEADAVADLAEIMKDIDVYLAESDVGRRASHAPAALDTPPAA